jgi:hypothetical protein
MFLQPNPYEVKNSIHHFGVFYTYWKLTDINRLQFKRAVYLILIALLTKGKL